MRAWRCLHQTLRGLTFLEGLSLWGYGHRLLPEERFTAAMTERRADSLLRVDLMKRLMMFKDYGKGALLLAVLSYNIGAGRLLGYGKHPKSRLLQKIESGNRNFYREFVSFYQYKGNILRGLVKRRRVEFALFYVPWLSNTPLVTFLCSARNFFLSFYSPFSLWMSNFAENIICQIYETSILQHHNP